FEKLKLNLHETKVITSYQNNPNQYFRPLTYDSQPPTYNIPIVLTESDFIFGKITKIKHYLVTKGDPNLLLNSTTIIPSITMPLIFYALLHKQKEILLLLIEHNAAFTSESVAKLKEIFRIL
ncbi:MAG TPA: hypothetical protein PLD88_12300, partial [Candidatus Berkiella sp.]|nr:hypothetical protein [Candidatus Berkiella sp.]